MNTVTSPFKAVIFDMDGTLLASTQADYLAWKKVFEEHGRELSFESYFPLLGMKSIDVVRSVLHLHGSHIDQALARKLEFFNEIVDVHGIDRIPFAEDFVKTLRGHNLVLGLATSSRRPKTEKVLKHTNLLQYFDAIVTGDEVENGKPAPDIFLKAAQKLNVAPAGCLVFEDAVSGVVAAKSAGMTCVAITTTHPAADLHRADLVINSFENLQFHHLLHSLKPKH